MIYLVVDTSLRHFSLDFPSHLAFHLTCLDLLFRFGMITIIIIIIIIIIIT